MSDCVRKMEKIRDAALDRLEDEEEKKSSCSLTQLSGAASRAGLEAPEADRSWDWPGADSSGTPRETTCSILWRGLHCDMGYQVDFPRT